MKNILRSCILILTLCAAYFSAYFVHADTASDLQQKIDDRNAQIQQLESQLNQYNAQANDVSKQANTLQSALKTLDLSQKKISADLGLTQNKISQTTLTITQINNQIAETDAQIIKNKATITKTIRNIYSMEQQGFFEEILSSQNVAEVWNDIDSIHQIQTHIKNQSDTLHALETDLESKQTSLQGQKKQLVGLQQDLTGKEEAVLSTEQEKATLLAETKNKQATYMQLIATTQAQKAQFEQEVFNFESELKLTIDPNGYPAPHAGTLSWPLDTIQITQLFGKTVGAEKLYVSGSHNGVDFRASIGTRVKNVLDGEVAGTGNTDAYPGCYSFGKWVMVRHDNGLSTIYGHLSVISVTTGQRLQTGDLIGYSGNTGYSTGPHLHISVYATQGVRIEQFVNSIGCKKAVIPLADIKAYLDPMAYFPPYPLKK